MRTVNLVNFLRLLVLFLVIDITAILSGTFVVHAQEVPVDRTLLLYVEKDDFLLPLIENTLKQLKHRDTKESVFTNVINLNRFEDDVQHQFRFREVIDFYSSRSFKLSKEAKRVHARIADELSHHNSFLRIKINKLQDLLEYQFTLYETIEVEERDEFPIQNIVNPSMYHSVFIDPTSEEYITTLTNALKRLFPETNSAPIAKILVNGRTTHDGSEFHFAIGDSILLDAGESGDNDTRRTQLKYKWYQIDLEGRTNIPREEVISLDPASKAQEITIHNRGTYKIGLIVNDGIADSQEAVVTFVIIDRPQIEAAGNYLRLLKQNSILSLLRNRPVSIMWGIHLSVSNTEADNVAFHIRPSREGPVPRKFIYGEASQKDSLEWAKLVAGLRSSWDRGQSIRIVDNQKTQKRIDRIGYEQFWDGKKLSFIKTVYGEKYGLYHYGLYVGGDVSPGEYLYEMEISYHGVKSNAETIFFAHRENSPFYFGYAMTQLGVSVSDSSDRFVRHASYLHSPYLQIFLTEDLLFQGFLGWTLSRSDKVVNNVSTFELGYSINSILQSFPPATRIPIVLSLGLARLELKSLGTKWHYSFGLRSSLKFFSFINFDASYKWLSGFDSNNSATLSSWGLSFDLGSLMEK